MCKTLLKYIRLPKVSPFAPFHSAQGKTFFRLRIVNAISIQRILQALYQFLLKSDAIVPFLCLLRHDLK